MKLMKKLLSLLLVAAILTNNFGPMVIFALDTNEIEVYQNIETGEEITPKGDIEVETHLVLPLRNREKNNIVFKIYDAENHSATLELNDINQASDGYYFSTLELGSQKIRVTATKRDKDGHLLSGVDYQNNIVYLSINLYSLDKGVYHLEFSGKNFVTYGLDVTLEDFSQRVTLTNETGMFEIGDVNSDGKVDGNDANVMLEAIEAKNTTYDLNLDGLVDIADLNYITAMITGKAKSAKVESTSAIIDTKDVSVEVLENVVKEGTLADLFQDEGVVTLQKVDDKPIELSLDLSGTDETKTVEMSHIRIGVGEEVPEAMTVIVETEDGTLIEKKVTKQNTQGIHLFTDEVVEGTIFVDLGKQVAVKKVTIVITEASTNNLADIAKVEFLNNVKVETKEPEGFYTPKNIKVDDSVSEQLTVTFNPVDNVTGYEIKIVGPKMENGTIFQTTYNTFTIEDLKNYATYKVYVQSVNQEWRSGWSEAVEASPKATRVAPKVDMVKATPTYGGIDFSWQDMDDTRSYNLYYREVGTEKWNTISGIKGISYSLRGLKSSTEYEAYVNGVNDLGESTSHTVVKAKTLEAMATIVPQYKLINTSMDGAEKNNHIKDVIYSAGTMTDNNKYSIVDDQFNTYFSVNDWQINAHYSNMGAPIIVLDNSYKMNEFILTVPDTATSSIKKTAENDLKVYYFEKDSYKEADRKVVSANLTVRKDENNRVYYVIRTVEPITATAIQFGLTAPKAPIEFNEVKIYEYDSLVDDVAALFTDDLRLVLADGVNQTRIDELRQRADEKDHDEYSPYRESVLADLDYAEKILKDEKIDDVITLNPNISNSYNGHLKFAMTISDYQPLGIVARPGETINVYVGTTGNVNAEIVFTQYHAEASEWSKTYTTPLTKGLNVITVPTIGSAQEERGGSVYIRYKSTPNANTPIKVRVSGGTKIPVLDTTLLTTEQEKKNAVQTYIEELKKYNSNLEALYAKDGLVFDKASSVLASTEIVTRHGLFSVSSIAVEDALESGTSSLEQEVDRLYESTEAFNEMMEMFYRQKGLMENAADSKDEMPKARINIRYMQMFDGAFMYAGGYHVGIEYGSIAGLIQAHRNTDSATGYFGWGISHEVGHQINQKDTVFAEVTNNIYALLAQTSNDKDNSRLESSNIYDKIYTKVTSHTLGRAQNVFVQLGMYWQLHLAYDENKTFDDVDSVYARINHISRTYENSKKYTRDELTILYACMATEKDLTDFFEIWGLKASDALKEEIVSLNYEKETRAIYYLNDAARRYRLSSGQQMSSTTSVEASISESNSKDKRVAFSFDVTGDSDKILGYEILRNGESIAFVPGDVHSYVDQIGAENNRAYTYSIVAYDYLLNKTEAKVLEEVKISHDGSVLKDSFTIESNVKEEGENTDYEDDEMDDSELAVNRLIDGLKDTFFHGTVKIKTLVQTGDKPTTTVDNGNAYVIINLNDTMSVSGIRYRAALINGELMADTITNYNIYVSSDKEHWTLAGTGTFNLNSENDYTDLVYFMKEGTTSKTQLWTYDDVSYVKIESVGNKGGLSGAEFDVIAPPGDNVDIEQVGRLEEDYCYLEGGCTKTDENGKLEGVIEKGSVVIKGSYRGSPSFNHVLIADPTDPKKVYGGYQLIFAELNDDHSVYEVAEGTWMFVMTQEEYETMLKDTKEARAYLYRVNDAIELSGQRLTSTSMTVELTDYESLSSMVISSQDTNR